jgi:zinc transport system substrate-binding protein
VRDALGDAGVDTSATGDALVRAVADLDHRFAEGLAGCRGRLIVTNHAAFGYLADAYGLRQESISGLSPEAEPDPAHLADLAARIRGEGVTTVFTESLVPPDVAQTLAEEAGVGVAVLDPLEGLTPARIDAGEDYLSVMGEDLQILREGLGC